MLSLLARGAGRSPDILAPGRERLLGLFGGGGGRRICLLAGVSDCALSLGVDRTHGGERVVAGPLGLSAGVGKDLGGLSLRGLDAVGGGAVGLGDALDRALLGALAQFAGGALCRLHDVADAI